LVITSPLTPASEGDCYTSRPLDGRTMQETEGSPEGVFEARVPLTLNTTILVKDAVDSEAPTTNVVAPNEVSTPRPPKDALFSWRGEQSEDKLEAALPVNAEDLDPEEVTAREQFGALFEATYDEVGKNVREALDGPGEDGIALRDALNEALYAAL